MTRLVFALLTPLVACTPEGPTEPFDTSEDRSGPPNWAADERPPGVRVSLGDLLDGSRTGDVTVPAGATVWLDGNAEAGLVRVEGTLRCTPGVRARIELDGLLVVGEDARFECGSPESRFAGDLTLALRGGREFVPPMMGHGIGTKAIGAMMGGTLSLHGALERSGFVRLDQDASAGDEILRLSEPVLWRVGDSLVVSTTSFDPHESEIRTVMAVQDDRVTLDRPLDFDHVGMTQEYTDSDGETWTVDERAYVADLSRHIRVTSVEDTDLAQQIGAQMMVMHHGVAEIEGVAFDRVGQMGQLGRYPFHWHRAGDVDGQYFRHNAVYQSFNRCVTVHATHGADITDNVCVDHYGHGFFLEEGNETRNTLAYNLAIGAKKVPQDRALLVSEFNSAPGDRFPGPASYWIAHPDNDVHHNAAVGSEGSGFWMAFRQAMRCDEGDCSPAAADDANVFPSSTDTLRFSDNVAMSSVTGITWDGAPDGDLIDNPRNPGKDFALVSAHYAPETTPTFARLEATKNAAAGLYFRGDTAIFEQAVLADNGTSAFFAYNQALRNSLVVGASDALTAADRAYLVDPRVDPQARHFGPLEGIRIYDGPFLLDNVHFADFGVALSTNGIVQTPVPIRMTGGASRWVNSVQHVTFDPEPHQRFDVSLAGLNWQDSYAAAMLDIDGSISGRAGTLIRPNHPLNDHPTCVAPDVDTLYCDYEVSNLRFASPALRNAQSFDVERSDGARFEAGPVGRGATAPHLNKFPMVQNERYTYTVHELDFGGGAEVHLRYSTRAYGDLSPVISVASAANLPCRLDELELSEGTHVAALGDLTRARGTTFTTEGGAFFMRLMADDERPKVTPESPNGLAELTLRCMP